MRFGVFGPTQMLPARLDYHNRLPLSSTGYCVSAQPPGPDGGGREAGPPLAPSAPVSRTPQAEERGFRARIRRTPAKAAGQDNRAGVRTPPRRNPPHQARRAEAEAGNNNAGFVEGPRGAGAGRKGRPRPPARRPPTHARRAVNNNPRFVDRLGEAGAPVDQPSRSRRYFSMNASEAQAYIDLFEILACSLY